MKEWSICAKKPLWPPPNSHSHSYEAIWGKVDEVSCPRTRGQTQMEWDSKRQPFGCLKPAPPPERLIFLVGNSTKINCTCNLEIQLTQYFANACGAQKTLCVYWTTYMHTRILLKLPLSGGSVAQGWEWMHKWVNKRTKCKELWIKVRINTAFHWISR